MRRPSVKGILLVAAVLRLALLAVSGKDPAGLRTPDSAGYEALAGNLATSGRFEQGGQPEIFRTPGYPFFLLLDAPVRVGVWRLSTLVQVAFDVLLVYLTYLLGWMLCDARVGVWAAAFQAVSAAAIAASLRVLSDGLFAVLGTLSLLAVIHHLRTGRAWSCYGAACVLAVACYVRPVGLAVAALVFVFLLLRPRRLARAGGFALIVIAAVAPWVLRNGLLGGYWGFSSLPAQAAFDYQAPAVLADLEGITLDQARQRLTERLPSVAPGTPGETADQRLRAAVAVLARHPGRYAAAHARGNLAVWMPAASDLLEIAGATAGGRGTLDVLRRRGLWAAVGHYFGARLWLIALCAPFVAVLAGKYVGIVLAAGGYLRRRMDASRWLVVATILLVTLVPGPAGHPRFRVPAEPLLSVAAAAGWLYLRSRRRRRRAAA